MKNGAYFAYVQGDRTQTIHVDEQALQDMQLERLTAQNQQARAARNKRLIQAAERAQRLKARKRRAMARDCMGLAATAGLSVCAWRWGIFAVIAILAGCAACLLCRILWAKK